MSILLDLLAWLVRLAIALECVWKKMWCWTKDVVGDSALSMVETVLDLIPEDLQTTADTMLDFLRVVDTWVPLSGIAFILGGYWTFLTSYIVIKFVRRCIPSMG